MRHGGGGDGGGGRGGEGGRGGGDGGGGGGGGGGEPVTEMEAEAVARMEEESDLFRHGFAAALGAEAGGTAGATSMPTMDSDVGVHISFPGYDSLPNTRSILIFPFLDII